MIPRPVRDSTLQAFEQYIKEYDWSPLLNAPCVDDKVNIFLKLTRDMSDYFFPCKSIKAHEDDKPYMTGRIKQMMRKRDKTCQSGRVKYSKSPRNKIISEIPKAKEDFYNRIIKPASSHNPKK